MLPAIGEKGSEFLIYVLVTSKHIFRRANRLIFLKNREVLLDVEVCMEMYPNFIDVFIVFVCIIIARTHFGNFIRAFTLDVVVDLFSRFSNIDVKLKSFLTDSQILGQTHVSSLLTYIIPEYRILEA